MSELQTLYIGTYTHVGWIAGEQGKGVYRTAFHPQTGRIEVLDVLEGVENPSFGCFNKAGDRLYVVNEMDGETGRVTSLEVQVDGSLRVCGGSASSYGNSPCYITLSPDEEGGFLTNYATGNAVALQMEENRVLGQLRQQVQHTGSSVNPQRQQGPRAHSLRFDSQGRFLFVADLGIDKVMIYRMVQRPEGLWMEPHGSAPVEPGMGPRHMVFDHSGKRLYLICEMGSAVYLFDYDPEAGVLTERQHITALPEGFTGANISADLHLSPDGRFLYGSNRGHNSIVIYRVSPEDGRLTLVGHQSTGGKTPRNFTLTADGRWLLAANQDSGSVVSFAVDTTTGLLEERARLEIPAPVWLGFRNA